MPPITPNVYVDTGFSTPPVMWGCNPGFVVTSEGIVLIDPPMYPTYAARWREQLAGKGEVRYVINTGHHPDHITGNYFFPGTVVSHQGIREKFVATLAKMRPSLGSEARPPASMGLRERILYRFREVDPDGVSLAVDYQPRTPTIEN